MKDGTAIGLLLRYCSCLLCTWKSC